MSAPHEVRLLPWTRADGKPCYLSADETGGYMWRLADNMEAIQLSMGTSLIDHACEILDAPKAAPQEIRYLASRLLESLIDALRVAESRGQRLAALTSNAENEVDGEAGDPDLPADAFG